MGKASAGAVKAGEAYVEISGDDTGFEHALKHAQEKLKEFGEGMKKIGEGLAVIGAVITGFFAESLHELDKEEKGLAQLDAVLKSTGGVAGVTKEQVLSLAESLSDLGTDSEDAIIQGENLLLTFTKIGSDIFPKATLAALDMSHALGQDMKSSVIQLGKALQDPILGITALRRVGVNFDDAMKAQIKTMVKSGDLLGAQKLILHELTTEFGGSTKATTAGVGALTQMHNKFIELQQDIAKAVEPAVIAFANKMKELIRVAREWVTQNQDVIREIAKIGLALTAAGAALLAVAATVLLMSNPIVAAFVLISGAALKSSGAFDEVGKGLGKLNEQFKIAGQTISDNWEDMWDRIVKANYEGEAKNDRARAHRLQWAQDKVAEGVVAAARFAHLHGFLTIDALNKILDAPINKPGFKTTAIKYFEDAATDEEKNAKGAADSINNREWLKGIEGVIAGMMPETGKATASPKPDVPQIPIGGLKSFGIFGSQGIGENLGAFAKDIQAKQLDAQKTANEYLKTIADNTEDTASSFS